MADSSKLEQINATLGAFTDWLVVLVVAGLMYTGNIDQQLGTGILAAVGGVGAFQKAKGKGASAVIPLLGAASLIGKKFL